MQQHRPNAEDEDERVEDIPPTPDQDGPHDVPDSQVIEKTLPAKSGEKPGS
jgi:hypothetical protein